MSNICLVGSFKELAKSVIDIVNVRGGLDNITEDSEFNIMQRFESFPNYSIVFENENDIVHITDAKKLS